MWDVSVKLSEDQKHIKRNEAITSSKLCLSFKTARNPPLYFLTHLVFSGFDATMYYNNPVLEYCGKWQNGLDIRINYDSMTAEELKLSIPKDWDVSFGEVA
jgi:hypothetical protein